MVVARVYGCQAPYWWVRHPDGDWEELSRRELISGAARTPGGAKREMRLPTGSSRRRVE